MTNGFQSDFLFEKKNEIEGGQRSRAAYNVKAASHFPRMIRPSRIAMSRAARLCRCVLFRNRRIVIIGMKNNPTMPDVRKQRRMTCSFRFMEHLAPHIEDMPSFTKPSMRVQKKKPKILRTSPAEGTQSAKNNNWSVPFANDPGVLTCSPPS